MLYNNTCIEDCPLKYKASGSVCILVGLVCPTDYELNSDATACIPKALTCEEGFELNDSGDKCIPDRTGIVPFPFIFLLICLTLIVVVSKIKDKLNTRWLANLIAFYGIVEPILFITFAIS